MSINHYFINEFVEPLLLDALWAEGWRHFGDYFYVYKHLPKDDYVYTVLPLRVRLKDFVKSKSQKRIWKRNSDLEVRIVPAYIDSEVEKMFHKHKKRFVDNIPESPHVFMSVEPATRPCEAKSLCFYEGDRLVGMSFLDIGHKSCSSVYQLFDPELTKRSLGIYMVLTSIKYCQEIGMDYYYPGYAYHESSHYDYKKRFNALEYFDWKSKWLDYERLTD